MLEHGHLHMPIPEAMIPYLIIVWNCLFFFLLRKLSLRIFPVKIHLFVQELISTIELCADCSELGVIWEKHGAIAYSTALFLCCSWWQRQFGQAEACPNCVFEDFTLNSVNPLKGSSIVRLFAQALAAFLVVKYLNCIWCFHFTQEHVHAHQQRCESSLQVGAWEGAAVEAMITFISRYVALHSIRWNEPVAVYTNSIVTVLLCLAAMDSSGGFFNPILASALTLNCKGNNAKEHFIVYWLGSVLGSIVARWFFMLKEKAERLKMD